MEIKIYYGLSGALKGSTIEAEKNRAPNTVVMESAIKAWKYYQFGVFTGLIEYNDLNFGILHLVRLRDFIEGNHDKGQLIVERGVTDMLYYYYYNCTHLPYKGNRTENPKFINSIIKEEQKILLPDFSNIRRILLVQKDIEFVKNEVMKDKYRRLTFNNDPDYYFKLQDDYVRFTTEYNRIDEIVEITDAKNYITGVLHQDWNIN